MLRRFLPINNITHRWWLVFACLVLAIYLLPYFVLHENAHILIHDNLDGSIILYKALANSDYIFSSNNTIVEQIMGGVPRGTFPSEFSFTMLWFCLLSPIDAYILERVIQACIGFIGMLLLLKKHVISGEQYALVQIGVALGFGLLPFWPFGGLSVAGLPLLLYAFLNLRQKDRKLFNWFVIAIFPFYAALQLSGIFFIAILGFIVLHDLIVLKRFNLLMTIGIGLLCLVFVFTHYRLFLSFFADTNYISHRIEIIYAGALSLRESFAELERILVIGQHHAHSLHTLFILPTVVGVSIVMWRNRQINKLYFYCLAFLLITSLFYSFWRWTGVEFLMNPVISLVPINLGRFHYLHPLVWSILFAVGLGLIQKYVSSGKKFVFLLIVAQLITVFSYHEIWSNRYTPTLKAFFAEEQFASIQAFINRPLQDYRVVSIGIHPSIAQYNGFYTLDGYMSDYPLSYKYQFREIIAPELAKDIKLREHFDDWGSRAYVFTEQLGLNYLHYKNNGIILTDLDLNLDVFQDLGGSYILSAVQIDVDAMPEYELLQVFKHPDSAWDIFLYQPASPQR